MELGMYKRINQSIAHMSAATNVNFARQISIRQLNSHPIRKE